MIAVRHEAADIFEEFADLFPGMETAPTAACRPRPTKGVRRTKSEIASIREALYEIVAEQRPMTVRQVFYQAVTRGVADKTEAEYKGTVVRLLGAMRREREIPFEWVADNTRWQRKPRTHASLAQMLQEQQRLYRRDLWLNQEVYVEVWLEKEALAGVLMDVTAKWDVPLMVTRGYPSISYLHTAAAAIAEEDKPAFLYYFGDHDPSGLDIPRKVERDLREFSDGADITFQRVAVTDQQIEEFALPTRPTKKTDSRAKSFAGDSVEVDAIPPGTIREIVADCIEQHVDPVLLQATRRVEDAERETLGALLKDNALNRET